MKYIHSLLLAICSLAAHGQVLAPKYSNEFLAIGVGARALGMARTQTAVAADVTAGYWNPAGLLGIKAKYEVSLMHAEYFAGIAKYDYLAFATPIDSVSHLGVSVIRFGVDDIPDTRFLFDANGAINYNNITFFSAADYAFLFSYARRFPKLSGLKFGANAKIIHRTVGPFANAWGFGFDVGLLMDRKNWRFGAMLRDVTSTFNTWSVNTALLEEVYAKTNNTLRGNYTELTLPRLSVGLAYRWRIRENFGALLAADADFSFDGKRNVLVKSKAVSVDPRVGFELDYKQIVFVRGGAGDVQQIKDYNPSTKLYDRTATVFQPNMGVGIRLNKFQIDYALTDIGDRSESLYSNVFSLKVGF